MCIKNQHVNNKTIAILCTLNLFKITVVSQTALTASGVANFSGLHRVQSISQLMRTDLF